MDPVKQQFRRIFILRFFLIEKTYQVRFGEAKKILSIKNDGEDL